MKHAIFFSVLLLSAFSGAFAGVSPVVVDAAKVTVVTKPAVKSCNEEAGVVAQLQAGAGQFAAGFVTSFTTSSAVEVIRRYNPTSASALTYRDLNILGQMGVGIRGAYDVENAARSLISAQPAATTSRATYIRIAGQVAAMLVVDVAGTKVADFCKADPKPSLAKKD